MASYYSGPTLTREQTAQLAYQAGARGDDLVFLTAVPERESGYVAGAHRTNRQRELLLGDRGLWQINYIWDGELKRAGIIQQASDLFDPLTNARAAVYVLRRQGRNAWMAYAGSQNAGVGRGLNMPAAQAAVNRAQQQGLLGTDWNQGTTGGTTGGTTTGTETGPKSLPRDALIVQNDEGLFALFDLGNGIFIHYGLGNRANWNLSGRPITRVSNREYLKRYGNTVSGGLADELTRIPAGFGTYKGYWDSLLNQILGTTNPARYDPEVLRVIAEVAGRPDMSEAEIENKLKATQWYQKRTEGELEWNSLSEAERELRRKETAARMAEQWRTFVGEPISPNDPRISKFIDEIASGKTGIGSWTESYVKPRALLNPESPWSRTLREEREAQNQRGNDIENTANRLREEARRWGQQLSEKTLLGWAQDIVEGTRSDKDVLDMLEKRARGLFPTLGAGLDVETAAAPYIETYRRVMEEETSVLGKDVMRAMVNGETLLDFETRLKSTTGWQDTANAREETFSMLGQVGQMFGYAGTN